MSLSPEKMASPHRSWKAYCPISNSPYEADLYTMKGIPSAYTLAVVMQDFLQEMPSVNVNDENVNPNVSASDGNENPNADAKRRWSKISQGQRWALKISSQKSSSQATEGPRTTAAASPVQRKP
jgi:hypothetical protein